MYKIDTNFEREQPNRNLRDRHLKQKRKSYSEIESEKVCMDSGDTFKTNNEKKLIQMSSENKVFRRTRNREPSLRLSAYHCGSLRFLK